MSAPDETLTVFHGETVVGELTRDADERLRFEYAPAWLDVGFGISASLPLTPVPHAGTFFANLLPEGDVRTLVARRLGVSAGNDLELLRALGGDCAGALSLGEPGSPEHAYDELDPEELVTWMDEGTPALSHTAGRAGTRLSLAGAQDKLPVRLSDDGRLLLPRGRAASTHILKFENRRFKHLVANELLTMRFAAALGLPTCQTSAREFDGRRALVVARYDRHIDSDGHVQRLHQEDLCQALGLPPTRKYESEGGLSFATCYHAVQRRSHAPLPDARALLDWMVFCALAGNADGHGKNLSMVRSSRGAWQLAPFYDLVCTGAYPRLSQSLAMTVGATADPCFIRGRDWAELARDMRASPRFVKQRVGDLLERAPDVFETVASAVDAELGRSPVLQLARRRMRKNVRSLRARLAE
ncbi:MAG: type II toxin-antitoxin system HipA family toxin [Sandaracinaceae bacterium]|nr:type II toxin-antitoxin system HipA family toxin [Sandaracinaceae bacterium]